MWRIKVRGDIRMDKEVSKRFLGHADYLQEIVKIINSGEQIDTDSLYELQ